ncbi:IclR family transcriptional regulator [Palleronia sp. LCG004]|uniref:IclR family transcriptional regulator n=1 Tax=Palleronia sp. LCG004 TaxID=3079304 RepID=UPI0029435681|nr:IclR family transcriptional regulator C-terminal domain-containing protein [Palleronia sp. LCG004]WOI57861.1 IclR family transcriptional regulator C-terminal domain-containing protein [Palleronia sp. LCG004]
MAGRDASVGASTFAKGLRVLECFAAGDRTLSMAAITRRTGLDRATVRRLCLTLVEAGYLSQNDRDLGLTPRILSLAGGYLAANEFGRAVQPVLNIHASELGGEIFMAMRDRGRAIYVAQSAMPGSRLSIGFVVGSSIPLLGTAVGRMILAAAPPEDLDQLLERGGGERHTEATDLDPASLRAKIARAAEQGYALVRDEFEMGVTALAVPVAGVDPTPTAIGTTLPTETAANEAECERVLNILRQTARSLRGHRSVQDF